VNAPLDEGRQKLAAKIAKLLRRAEREDGPEAETAMKMAHRLMSRHGLEVELHEFEEGPNPLLGDRMVLLLKGRKQDMWAQFLLQQIAPIYHCTNRNEEVDFGYWTFHVVGPPGQLEPCAIHFEYLNTEIRRISKLVLEEIQMPTTMQWFDDSSRISDGVHWGVMDGLLRTLSERFTHAQDPQANATVTVLQPMLALLPADLVAVRGNEVAVCDQGDLPFGDDQQRPDDITAHQHAQWAWMRGMRAALGRRADPPDVIYKPVAHLHLSPFVEVALRAAGIHTVAQLVRLRPGALLQIPKIYDGDLREINECLANHQLALTPDWN
jgi:hypothetical protein